MVTSPSKDELRVLSSRDRLLHLIYTQQFTRTLLEELFEVAEQARRMYTSRIGAGISRACFLTSRLPMSTS